MTRRVSKSKRPRSPKDSPTTAHRATARKRSLDRPGCGGSAYRYPRSTRHYDRECGDATHAGRFRGNVRPDHLGTHLLSRRCRYRDAVDGLFVPRFRTKASSDLFDCGLCYFLRAVRPFLESPEHGDFPNRPGNLRGSASSIEPIDSARSVPPREARASSCHLWPGHHGSPRPGPRLGRLAD